MTARRALPGSQGASAFVVGEEEMTQPVELAPVVPQTEPRSRARVEAAPPSAVAGSAAGSTRAAPPHQSESASKTARLENSATRLLVEPGKGAEGFVYKLVDRTTGQVLSEFPRQAASTLAKSPVYQAGAVLDESA